MVDLGAESRKAASARRPRAMHGEMGLLVDAAYGSQAQTLLSEVERNLGQFDRTKLDANKLQVYANASTFAAEGYKALRANDNLAALGFAKGATAQHRSKTCEKQVSVSKRAGRMSVGWRAITLPSRTIRTSRIKPFLAHFATELRALLACMLV
jgi:hypothetical protein